MENKNLVLNYDSLRAKLIMAKARDTGEPITKNHKNKSRKAYRPHKSFGERPGNWYFSRR
jgi:hypothetical protein